MEFPRQEYWSGFPFSYSRGTTGIISYSSEGRKSKFNMPALLSASEDPLQGCGLPTSHCIFFWQRVVRGSKLSLDSYNAMRGRPTWTHLILITFQSLTSSCHSFNGYGFSMNFEGSTNNQSITPSSPLVTLLTPPSFRYQFKCYIIPQELFLGHLWWIMTLYSTTLFNYCVLVISSQYITHDIIVHYLFLPLDTEL